jgi:uncharacterized repeat protein (TIGR01451 family)
MTRTSFIDRIYASLGLTPSGKSKAASQTRSSRHRRLRLEPLETRAYLSISPGVQISGTAFSNLLQNGQPTGEPVIQGVTVDLYKDGGNGTFDGGTGPGADDTLVGSPVVTDASGHFSFPVFTAGTYFVNEVTPNGYIAPKPITVTVTSDELAGTAKTEVDGFSTTQSVTGDPVTRTEASSIAAPEAIGGHRDLSIDLTSASGEILLEVNPSYDAPNLHLMHFDTLGNGGTGSYTLAWDGANPNTPPALNYTGLGGVNLTAGGATGMSLSVGADHDNATATFTIYKDANDWSTATVNVPGPSAGIGSTNPNEAVYVPFSSFTTGGGTGAGNLTNVGAIELQIAGGIAGLNGQISSVSAVAPTAMAVNLPNTPEADLQITKTDGKTAVVPGTSDTYTVVVTNAGPSAVSGASIVDTFPSTFTNVTYTAKATDGASGFATSGSRNLDQTNVTMPVGSTITYTVRGNVAASAWGFLTNTATVEPPAGVVDPNLTNNTATHTDLLTPEADLQITKTDGKTSVVAGRSDTYTVVVTNAGPSAVSGASIVDTFPSIFSNVTYTATATGGASGFATSGSGNLDQTNVTMPVSSTITYTLTGLISASATGLLTNTATVAVPPGVIDPNPGNNIAVHTDTITPKPLPPLVVPAVTPKPLSKALFLGRY